MTPHTFDWIYTDRNRTTDRIAKYDEGDSSGRESYNNHLWPLRFISNHILQRTPVAIYCVDTYNGVDSTGIQDYPHNTEV